VEFIPHRLLWRAVEAAREQLSNSNNKNNNNPAKKWGGTYAHLAGKCHAPLLENPPFV
jgi:hypothetical protein